MNVHCISMYITALTKVSNYFACLPQVLLRNKLGRSFRSPVRVSVRSVSIPCPVIPLSLSLSLSLSGSLASALDVLHLLAVFYTDSYIFHLPGVRAALSNNSRIP